MQQSRSTTGFLLTLISSLCWAQQADSGWPRTILSDGTRMEMYQPQVDKWENGKLDARAAVAVSDRASGQSLYGAVWISGKTTLDQERRLVTLYDIDTSKATFPSADAQESTYVKQVSEALQQWSMTISLDRLLADIAITQSQQKRTEESFNSSPPRIFVRQNPAVLILIDGEPVMQKIENTKLMRVLNSPAMIVLDTESGRYYLRGDNYWMTAAAIAGPWSRTDRVPAPVGPVLAQTDESASASPTTGNGAVPEIIISTEPAELIQFQGEPQFTPIEGTRLLYVTNTDSDVFLSMQPQLYYVLLSGRWFSAAALYGPWDPVSQSSLPLDFARIPADHPKAAVLASISGTPQARDAVVAAEVPQTATVDRKQAAFTTTYDGDPEFRQIDGTDMSYAVNSADDIIQVRNRFYAVSNGVWFVADNPSGPWVVCDSVPSQIYSIPPDVPVYNARYVYVYDSTPDYVYVGYLPGYFGAFSWDGVVVYGTGYYYPCWCRHYYWGWPWTWGFGFHYGYWGGGYFWRPWYPRPWYWHPWRWEPPHPVWWNSRVLYNRAVRGSIARTANAPHPTVYARWQSSAVTYRTPVSLRPPLAGVTRRPTAVPREVPTAKTAPARPDLYVGKNGSVYQHRQDGWYKQNGRNWEKIAPVSPLAAVPPSLSNQPNRPTPPASLSQRQGPYEYEEMERDRQARIQGQNRTGVYGRMPAPQRSTAPPPRFSAPPPRTSAPAPRVSVPRGGGQGRPR